MLTKSSACHLKTLHFHQGTYMLRSVTMLASSSCCTPSTLSCSIQSNRAGEGEGEGEGEEEGEGVVVREKGEGEGGGVRGGREDS